MFQQMINGSIAVLTRPSASTFEEHEQNNLGWALIWSLIAGLINAVLSWIGSLLFPPRIPGLESDMAAGQPSDIFFLIPTALIGTVVFLLIYWGNRLPARSRLRRHRRVRRTGLRLRAVQRAVDRNRQSGRYYPVCGSGSLLCRVDLRSLHDLSGHSVGDEPAGEQGPVRGAYSVGDCRGDRSAYRHLLCHAYRSNHWRLGRFFALR